MLPQLPFVQLNGIFKPQVNGIANERMADGYFEELRDMLCKILEVVQVEVVPCIDA